MKNIPIEKIAAATPETVARRIRGLSDRSIAWIFVAPTIFLLLAINIFPLIWTIWLSFTNSRVNRPNRDVEWVGLRNYERILSDSDIWNTMQATAHFLIWTIVLQVLIGFFLAFLINKKFRGNDLWTTIIEPGALGHCDCRHLDVDAVCNVDLSGRAAIHSKQYL